MKATRNIHSPRPQCEPLKTQLPKVNVRPAIAAFSLIELLTVIAIVALLMGLVGPPLSSLGRAKNVSSNAHEVAELIEMARSHALAYNTIVEIGFNTAAEGLSAVVVAGRDGQGSPIPLSRIRHFPAIRLDTVETSSLKRPTADIQLSSLSGGFPKFTLNGRDFDQVIQFNSRGEARVLANSLSRLIEIDFLPNVDGQTPDSLKSNAAVLQVSGLSGNVSVYRP